jgi:hypothetical protein
LCLVQNEAQQMNYNSFDAPNPIPRHNFYHQQISSISASQLFFSKVLGIFLLML